MGRLFHCKLFYSKEIGERVFPLSIHAVDRRYYFFAVDEILISGEFEALIKAAV